MRNRAFLLAFSVLFMFLAVAGWNMMSIRSEGLQLPQEGKKGLLWNEGKNNPAAERGVTFTVPGVNNVPDLHGDPTSARLVIFLEGNYFFLLPDLIDRFTDLHPDLKGKIFYETLPGGILTNQIRSGNAITIGNLTLHVTPDVFQASPEQLKELISERLLEGPIVRLFRNRLAIMVAKGNPKGISSLADLARPGIRIANPNPETEGIVNTIEKALEKAGGKDLYDTLYKKKVDNGEAAITAIHHRQTPLWIMSGNRDAGIAWITEAKFQQRIGNPIDFVELPSQENVEGQGAAARVRNAPHGREARLWLEFVQSESAVKILREYGFEIIRQAGAQQRD